MAWQLAIYKFVPSLFDLDGALADMQQESEIADVVARNQGAESGAVVGAKPVAVGAEQYDIVNLEDGKNYVRASRKVIEGDNVANWRKQISNFFNELLDGKPSLDIATLEGDVLTITKNETAAKARDRYRQADGKKEKMSDAEFKVKLNAESHIDELAEISTKNKKGAPDTKGHTFAKDGFSYRTAYFQDHDGQYYKITLSVGNSDGTATIYNVGKIEEGELPSAKISAVVGSQAPRSSSSSNSIHQNEPVVNPEAKEISSNKAIDEKGKNSRSGAVEVESEQTGAETVQDETAGASPRPTGEFGGQGEVIDGATSSSTVSDGPPSPLEKADLDRAKRDAERIIEWEKKEAPTVDELNRVRGAVKNFDSLSGDRQRAIVRMVRSAKNIDEGVIRGVSNIMAITNKKGAVLAPDVEIRFAEFGKDSTRRGIKTEVGGKTVIVLNANAKSTDILRGTIAHEIVHYLENRKGYKALAEYAMKHAKAEKVAQVRETYRKQYTIDERKANPNATEEEIAAKVDEKMRDEAAVNSEIVGNVVAELLGSEKFLKRYAQMGEEQSSVVKKIARFVKGIANALKDKDGEAGEVARQMMDLVDRALGSEVEGEKSGTKFDIDKANQEYIDAKINSDVLSLVERVEKNQHDKNDKVEMGIVTGKVASDIYNLTGINVDGFKIVIEARLVEHILNDHGKNGKSDRTMSDNANIARLEYTLNNYDDISRGKSTQAYKNIIDGKTRGAQTVLYEKSIGEKSYYVVQAVPDTKAKTLFIVSTLIGDHGYKKEAPQFAIAESHSVTSEIGTADTSNKSIQQNAPVVNTSDKKSSNNEQYDLDPQAVEREAKKLTPKTEKTEKKKAESSTSGIKTGSAEAGRYSRGMRYEFGLDKKFEAAIRSKLESLEEVFIKGDREAYVEEYKKRVEEIFDIVRREGVIEVATDNFYRGFQTYMRGKKFRVDKRFRQNMGKEEWKGVYSVIRGRLVGLNKMLF